MSRLEIEAAEARALLADLAAIGTELDEDERATVIEGETTLPEAIASALVEAEAQRAGADATGELIERLRHRRERQLDRDERIRSRVARALSSLGLRKLSTAMGTVSVVASPPRVLVYSNVEIPEQWWRERVERVLDKAGIRKALLEGQQVPGTELSNRPDTIRVRM